MLPFIRVFKISSEVLLVYQFMLVGSVQYFCFSLQCLRGVRVLWGFILIVLQELLFLSHLNYSLLVLIKNFSK